MFQVITKRHDQLGYHIHLSNIPEELKEDSIVFMPEISTKEVDHIKYVSKYTHKSGNIIVKLVRSDGYDPFDRPKSLSHSLIVPSEEYIINSMMYYASPIINSDLFDNIENEPILLNDNHFQIYENKIAEKIDMSLLREILVAVMIEPKVILQLDLETQEIIELSSLIDKSIPYEATFDFSLITYSNKKYNKQLVHNVICSTSRNLKSKNNVVLRSAKPIVSNIAKEERKYLDDYIEMILSNDYENLLREHAKWFIGKYYIDYKKLQKMFTKRYQLNIPFSRRDKFHARFVKSLSKADL